MNAWMGTEKNIEEVLQLYEAIGKRMKHKKNWKKGKVGVFVAEKDFYRNNFARPSTIILRFEFDNKVWVKKSKVEPG